jgi:ABC-type sugar transport system ATPase subunit
LDSGEIVGLVGPNGAGKSTFGRVLVGELPFGAYQGELKIKTMEARFSSTREAHETGIVLIHQEGAAIDQLSIGENVMLTIEPGRHGWIDWPALHTRAFKALDRLGAATDTRQRLGEHGGVALMELVEIARSLVRGGSIFVFDESTSALGAEEIRTLLAKMRELAATGAGIIFISHRINEILSVCHRIVVLRDGRKVLDAPRAELNHQSIVRAMLGGGFSEQTSRMDGNRSVASGRRGDILLQMKNWHVKKSDVSRIDLGPINFDVRRGEILGVFGPLGAGKSELLQSLFGLMPESCSGTLWWKDRDIAPFSNPRSAIASGLALVSSDRQKEGIIPQLSLLENMMLGHHRRDLSWQGLVVKHDAGRRLCENLIRQLNIRTTGPDQPVSALSGGNQQKVLLARAMIHAPQLLLLDEPTRGIDVGAKQDVYHWIRQTAANGTSFVVSSLEEAELLGLAQRLVVLRDGRQLSLLEVEHTSEHELMVLAAGGTRH